MTRNPIVNATATVLYIALVVVFLLTLSHFLPEPTNPLGPMLGFLSLFVFSAAVTGYLMIGAPLQLLIEGQKQEAVSLFLKTMGAFAGIAALASLAAFLISAL